MTSDSSFPISVCLQLIYVSPTLTRHVSQDSLTPSIWTHFLSTSSYPSSPGRAPILCTFISTAHLPLPNGFIFPCQMILPKDYHNTINLQRNSLGLSHGENRLVHNFNQVSMLCLDLISAQRCDGKDSSTSPSC